MSRTAFVFPGQGSQRPDVLSPFLEEFPSIEERIDAVDDGSLADLLFAADAETLRHPARAQPAILAASVLVAEAIVETVGVRPDAVAGHSLGHISAATVAGAFELGPALELVRERGQLMADAEREAGPGTMVAVLLTDPETVEECVEDVAGASLAAVNAPRQSVVSGRQDAVDEALERVTATAQRARTVELDVGSGFHSPVMEPAVEPFAALLAETPVADPSVPIVSDVSASAYQSAAVLQSELRAQLQSPVLWRDVVETLSDRGVERFVVAPPASELATLVERTTDATVLPIDGPDALSEVAVDA